MHVISFLLWSVLFVNISSANRWTSKNNAIRSGGKIWLKNEKITSQSKNFIRGNFSSTDDLNIRGGERREQPPSSRVQQESDKLVYAGFSTLRTLARGVSKTINITGNTAAMFAGGGVKLVGAAIADISESVDYLGDTLEDYSPAITKGYVGGALRAFSAPLKMVGDGLITAGETVESGASYTTQMAEGAVKMVLDGALGTAEELADFALGHDQEKEQALDDAYFEPPLEVLNQKKKETRSTDQQSYERTREKSSAVKQAPFSRVRLLLGRIFFTRVGTLRAVFHFWGATWLVHLLKARYTSLSKGLVGICGFYITLYVALMELLHQERVREATRNEILGVDANDPSNDVQHPFWINSMVEEIWPSLEPNLSAQIGLSISKAIQHDADGDNYSFLGLSRFTLGSKPPVLRYVRVITQKNLEKVYGRPYVMSQKAFEHFENSTKTNPKFIYAEAGLDYRSTNSEITLNLGKTRVRGESWWRGGEAFRRRGTPKIPTSAKITMTGLIIQMKILVAMELSDMLEPDYAFVSFIETPRVRFSLKPLGAFDLTKLPGFGLGLQYAIERVLKGFTDPNFIEIDLLTAEEKENSLQDELMKNIVDLSTADE